MTVHGDTHQLEYLVKKQLLTSLKCSVIIVLPHFLEMLSVPIHQLEVKIRE